MSRRLVALVLALGTLAPSVATAATLSPSQWPGEVGLGSSTSAIRFGGTDRYATSLAMTLAMRGEGGYPFDTPDRTSVGAGSLAEASDWWGPATCPAAVIVVAGDTPADALAAAPLSDPTNRSNQPRLQRVAAADPLFDPVGGFDRVDTFAAPIIVTLSGRSGARGLAASARAAVTDLATGGCTRAREAIIVGGDAAVPTEVEGELVSLGYEEVFRVAGSDRFDTAARIATALGTEAATAGDDCADERVDARTAMGFHGNAVIEYRPDAVSCELHGRTVVLADGSVGADALAAGWWTSYWQVPVLLVAGDGSLPPATRTALQTMSIDTIVVLGGTGRIPESVVNQATFIAGAVAGRFAGRDRYETSSIMAEVFGGWYPVDPDAFASDRACIAASTGSKVGWPDALAAGPWCGRLSAAATVAAPSRSLEPVERTDGLLPAVPPAHDAAPILLVPAHAAAPTAKVQQLLGAAFRADGDWCGSGTAPSCRPPGFAVAFGGRSMVTDALLDAVSVTLAGGDVAQAGPAPVVRDPFRTTLDLAPVYDVRGADGDATACVERNALASTRWLAVYADEDLHRFLSAVDLSSNGPYIGVATSEPMCIRLGTDPSATRALVGVAGSGRATTERVLRGGREHTTTMSASMRHGEPVSSSGESGTSEVPGTITTWRFDDVPPSTIDLRKRLEITRVLRASAEIFLTRGRDGAPHHFVAELAIDDGGGGLAGEATGEAILGAAGWELAGRFRLPSASGGFRATLDTRGTPDVRDDALVWRLDAAAP